MSDTSYQYKTGNKEINAPTFGHTQINLTPILHAIPLFFYSFIFVAFIAFMWWRRQISHNILILHWLRKSRWSVSFGLKSRRGVIKTLLTAWCLTPWLPVERSWLRYGNSKVHAMKQREKENKLQQLYHTTHTPNRITHPHKKVS